MAYPQPSWPEATVAHGGRLARLARQALLLLTALLLLGLPTAGCSPVGRAAADEGADYELDGVTVTAEAPQDGAPGESPSGGVGGGGGDANPAGTAATAAAGANAIFGMMSSKFPNSPLTGLAGAFARDANSYALQASGKQAAGDLPGTRADASFAIEELQGAATTAHVLADELLSAGRTGDANDVMATVNQATNAVEAF